MAFCGKCGAAMADGAGFCPQCGAAAGPAAAGPAAGPPVAVSSAGAGMQENVAGLLCYLVGWITGIIFFLIDKRPFVRFHAAQSMVVFGALFILSILCAGVMGAFVGMWGFWLLISRLLDLVSLVAWIGLMIVAYQGKRYEVPIAGGIAKKIAGQA